MNQPTVGEKIGGTIGKEIGQEIGKNIENNLTGKNRNGTKKLGKSPMARRIEYAFGIAFALVFLWIISNLSTWNWSFITSDWKQIAGIVRVSIIIDIIVYAVMILIDARVMYYLGKLLMDVFSFTVGIRMFQVFPFDFQGGWNWLNSIFPVVIFLGLVAIGITSIVRTVKLSSGQNVYF